MWFFLVSFYFRRQQKRVTWIMKIKRQKMTSIVTGRKDFIDEKTLDYADD